MADRLPPSLPRCVEPYRGGSPQPCQRDPIWTRLICRHRREPGAGRSAILSTLTDTMIPQAVEGKHRGTGLIAGAGLRTAFALSQPGG